MKRIENQNKIATKRKTSSDSVKHPRLTDCNEETTPLILTKKKHYPHKGDWRRDKKIRIAYKTCTITWSYTDEGAPDPFLIKTPVPVDMPTGSIPVAVRNHSGLEKSESFQPSNFFVTVSFSGKSIYQVLLPIDMFQCCIWMY